MVRLSPVLEYKRNKLLGIDVAYLPVIKPKTMSYRNLYQAPPPQSPVTAESELFEHTPAAEYDLNSFLPVPEVPLETSKVRLEPLVPSIHADALSKAFSTPSEDPDEVWFYPFPAGRALASRIETLVFMEKQRRRSNLLTFAIIDKITGNMAGTISLGCDPTQATLDAKIIGMRIFPAARGTHVLTNACFTLLSYALDPVAEGGLGLVRIGWRTPPENLRSQKAAEKLGLTREGTMRCYEVSPEMPGSPYPNLTMLADGTRRVTEDGVVFSMVTRDWLDGKRERLRAML